MGRILAIDYGVKRTGIAVTDILQIIATGLTTIRTADVLDFLNTYVETEKVERIVVGFPTQMSGEQSDNAKNVLLFVKKLKAKLPQIPVEYYDERFTSVLAHQTMLESGLHKKKRQDKALVDKISATIILQSYLESKALQ